MRRLRRWFKTREALFAELANLDKACREFQARTFMADRCIDQYDELVDDMQDEIREKTQRIEAQNLLLSALGAVEQSKAGVADD
jgi:IS1 family transposase